MAKPRPTAIAPFSMRMDPQTRARLEEEARRSRRSSSYIAARAIEAFLDSRQEKRAAIAAAVAEADKGAFVSSEAIDQWMDSWGSEHELPFPQADAKLPRR